jgi:DNA/RNA-binding domain of Phe-tRNA-synthetase-like protein
MIVVKPQLTVPVRFGVLTAQVTVSAQADGLWTRLQEEASNARAKLQLAEIAELPEVSALRAAYRACGRDPQRYRGSAEALLRRVIQDKPLYRVNTIVDTNNLISLRTGAAVGSYDMDQIMGPVVFRTGSTGESYAAIGKGEFSLENLPVFADDNGPFGSPTSDSDRTMVRLDTTSIALIVISFACADPAADLRLAADLLTAHSAARDIEIDVVG